MATTGTVTLDFGAAPGTNIIVATVTGQTGVLSTSYLEAWIMADSTTDHNAYEHAIAPIKLTCGNIVVGTSFDITAVSDWRLSGTFKCRWVSDY